MPPADPARHVTTTRRPYYASDMATTAAQDRDRLGIGHRGIAGTPRPARGEGIGNRGMANRGMTPRGPTHRQARYHSIGG